MLIDRDIKYLQSRGISKETADALGIVSHATENAIGFKYKTFTKFRTDLKRFSITPSGQRMHLWNVENAIAACKDTVCITEGEFDCASMVEAGMTSVVSVPTGAGDGICKYLYNDDGELIPLLANAERIVIATDNDQAGCLLGGALIAHLGKNRCWAMTFPEGCKDPNDVLAKHGAEALRRCARESSPLVPCNDIIDVDDAEDAITLGPYSPGWRQLADKIKLCPPELAIVTGTHGSGKTQWVTNSNFSNSYFY